MIRRSSVVVIAGLAVVGCGEADTITSELEESVSAHHEVWLLDQSNSNGTFGGRIYIWSNTSLMGDTTGSAVPSDVIDLGGAASSLCLASTGANPVRPHMIFFSPTESHAVIAFVASGHVLFMEAATRTPVACFRMSVGAGGARQAHAANPDPLGRYVIVANQNGKLLERIDTDYSTGTFVHNTAATLDLANCTTPNGVPCQLAGVRPDNAPICPIHNPGGLRTFVTLRGGGLFVVDPIATPMAIVGEYTNSAVNGNGCGGVVAGTSMWIDSGGGTAANLHQFDVYRFPLYGYSPMNPPNTPAPVTVFSDPNARDAHGMVAGKKDRFVWTWDRANNVAEVFDVSDSSHDNTVALSHPNATDPTPDLAVLGPKTNRMYISLRGPNPLSGDPHVATGSPPGLGVIQVTAGGADGNLINVVTISNVDAMGIERADAHGIAVRSN